MKNPQRIPKILKKIETIWKTSPDLNLGQILTILQRKSLRGNLDLTPPPPMIFYFSDEDLEKELDSLI